MHFGYSGHLGPHLSGHNIRLATMSDLNIICFSLEMSEAESGVQNCNCTKSEAHVRCSLIITVYCNNNNTYMHS